MLLILSENWTLTDGRNLTELVQWARIAEDAGFDSVMISEHIVLGPDASDKGVMANPRAYALPGNQDPLTPWPNSLMLLSAMASVTSRIRLVAVGGAGAAASSAAARPRTGHARPALAGPPGGAAQRQLEPRRVCGVGRAVRRTRPDSRRAAGGHGLGIPGVAGQLPRTLLRLRRHLSGTQSAPARRAAYVVRRADRTRAVVERLVRYGHGFHPLGAPTAEDMQAIDEAMTAAGRDAAELEMIGGVSVEFADDHSCADIGKAMGSIPAQLENGFTTICLKPSMFIDDASELPAFCADVMRRAGSMAAH